MIGLTTRNTNTVFLFLLVLLIGGFHCSKAGNDEIKAPGIVDGEIITLKAAAAGTIRQMDVKEGHNVTKDGPVARMNTDKIENQLQELDINRKEIDVNAAKISKKIKFLAANIRHLRKQVERFRRLKKKNSIPGEKLENMELKLLEAETSRFELEKNLESLSIQKEKIENKKEYIHLILDDHTISSPVDGVVIEKFVSIGESVMPGSAIVDILDTSSLYVEIFVEEKEIARLKLNQEVKIRVDGMADEKSELTGVISYFGKKAEFSPKYIISEKERKSLLYQVKIRITDNAGVLKIGMPVTVYASGGQGGLF